MSHTKITNAVQTKIDLFKQLSEFDLTTNESKLVCKDEFINEYAALQFTNGGDWCRQSSFAKAPNNFKFATAKANGKINILWDNCDDKEAARIKDFFKKNCKFTKGNSIKYFKIFGLKPEEGTRAIRKDILAHYKKQRCVHCGSNAEIQCDHKNGLYNDPRVLNLETQTLDDFQALCRHCNCQKRQIDKKTKSSKKRYGATNIISLKCYEIDFIEGDATLDLSNPNAMRGTYWYDPIAFHKHIANNITQLQAQLDKLKINNASEEPIVEPTNKIIAKTIAKTNIKPKTNNKNNKQ
jgi:hypothetical protein